MCKIICLNNMQYVFAVLLFNPYTEHHIFDIAILYQRFAVVNLSSFEKSSYGDSGRCPWFLKKRLGPVNNSRLPNWHFSKSIWNTFQWSNPFPEWIIDSRGQYKYVIGNRISKLEKFRFLRVFEIYQYCSRNSIFGFTRLLVLPILKRFLMKLARWNLAYSFLTIPWTIFLVTQKNIILQADTAFAKTEVPSTLSLAYSQIFTIHLNSEIT